MEKYPFDRSLEDILAERSGDFTMKPSKGVWNGVQEGLKTPPSTSNLAFKAILYSTTFLTLLGLSYLLPTDHEVQESPYLVNQLDLTSPTNQPQAGIIEVSASPLSEEPAYYDNLITPAESITRKLHQTPNISALAVNWEKSEPTREQTPALAIRADRPSPKKAFIPQWGVKLNYTGAYSYRSLKAKNTQASYLSQNRNETDRALMAHHVDLGLRYKVDEDFAIDFGVAYSTWGERVGVYHPELSHYYDSSAREMGYNPDQLYKPGYENFKANRFHQIEVPVTLNKMRKLGSAYSPLSLNTQFGISASYAFGNQYMSYDKSLDHMVYNKQAIRRWNLNLVVGAQLQYEVGDQLQISTGPGLRYSLLSTLRDSNPISQNHYALGWSLGMQWRILRSQNGR